MCATAEPNVTEFIRAFERRQAFTEAVEEGAARYGARVLAAIGDPGPLLLTARQMLEAGTNKKVVEAAMAVALEGRAQTAVIGQEFFNALAVATRDALVGTLEVLGLPTPLIRGTGAILPPDWLDAPTLFTQEFPALASNSVQSLGRGFTVNASKTIASVTTAAANPASPLTIPQATAQLRERMSTLTAARARMIARTETARAYGAATQMGYEKNGIKRKRWITAANSPIASRSPVCPTCLANAADQWVDISHRWRSLRGGAILHQPAHPNCRCDTVADTKGWLPPKQPFPATSGPTLPGQTVTSSMDAATARARISQINQLGSEIDAIKVRFKNATREMFKADRRVADAQRLSRSTPGDAALERAAAQEVAEQDRLIAIRRAIGKEGDAARVTNAQKLQRVREQVLTLPEAEQTTVNLPNLGRKGTAGNFKTVKEGSAKFRSMVRSRKSLDDSTIQFFQNEKVTKRAFQRKVGGNTSEIHVISRDPQDTVIHEMGHHFEMVDKDVHKRLIDLRTRRTVGESPTRLDSISTSYEADEITFKDEWFNPYAGKVYRGQASEMLSMGMQEMWVNPIQFAASDPEYFDVIWNIIRALPA